MTRAVRSVYGMGGRPAALPSLLVAIVAVAFLATGGVFVRLSEVGPIVTGFYRILFALPLAYLWMTLDQRPETESYKAQPIRRGRTLMVLFVAGLALGADLICWNISFQYTTLANANLLANLVPFVVIPLSFFILGQRPTLLFMSGLAVALVGLVVLIAGKPDSATGALKGDLLAGLTAVFYGVYLFLIAQQRRTISTGTVMFYSSFGTLTCLAVASVLAENVFLPSTITGWLVLASLAVLSHIAGQGLMALSLRDLPVNLASVIVLLQPVMAAIYALLLFDEKLAGLEVLGISVTLVGIYLAKRSSTG